MLLILCSCVLLIGFGQRSTEAKDQPGLTHALRAQHLMQNQRNEEALPEWEAALRLEPANARYRNLYGLAEQAVGRTEAARQEFRKAILIDPRLTDAYSNLAYSLWSDGDEHSAGLQFDAALRLQPSDPSLHLARGLLDASGNKLVEACKHFDRAHPWPHDAETLWVIFESYLRTRQPDKAVQVARRMPADFRFQMAIGRALRGLHQSTAAIPFLERARVEAPLSMEATVELCNAYIDSGQPERALATVNDLPAGDRVSFEALELIGSELL
jgi:tetratricopeptide (TPR) repeat protein